ncbi:DUF1707 and DUF4190 domain-containing protein [Streptomyces sp. NPDC051940]|uniref:DUF1707 and DUF4190 domain-containing protein n=1 Tax=Streptomyces sp. NPDC051940 TaxID=3155675 RepID=UPI003419883C
MGVAVGRWFRVSSMQPWGQGQPPAMRASDSDRERAADVLKAGYAEGRLDKTEYDDRLHRVHSALTYGELHHLIADLPQGPVPGPMAVAGPVPVPFLPVHPLPPNNSTATAAFACGIGTLFTGGLTGIPAVILGHKARAEIRRTRERGDGLALTGLVMGWLAVASWAIVILVVVVAVAASGK